jgi:hypothetical protein
VPKAELVGVVFRLTNITWLRALIASARNCTVFDSAVRCS